MKRDQPAIFVEILSEYRYSKLFLVQRILSTDTESLVSVLKAVFGLEGTEF